MLWIAFLVAAASSGPPRGSHVWQLPPEAYLDPVDQEIARTGVGLPGRPMPCSREQPSQGYRIVVRLPTDECLKMLPPQHFRGLWRNDFEGSQFCPEPAKECEFKSPGERVWLDYRPTGPIRRGLLYHVDFIGRKTITKGQYGHLGGYDSVIIVDRMIIYGEAW